MKGVCTLIKIGVDTLMEYEQENTIQKKFKITNFQTEEIRHSTYAVFVSIYCIFKYLQYFHVLFIRILIVAQLQIEKKNSQKMTLSIVQF
jgi:hypothetical protein